MRRYESLSIIIIFVAEALMFSGYRTGALAVHSLNILVVLSAVVLEKDIKLLQALSLVSLFRIVNISMPIFFSFTIYWLVSLYVIMFIPIILVARDQGLSLRQLGVTSRGTRLLPVAVIIGAWLALIEYSILSPKALIPALTLGEILKLSIAMFFFIGLVEELIFRALLQQRFEEKIGLTNGLLAASLLFGAMHSGYSSYKEILFATFAGTVIGFSFQRTKSLPFAIVVHGINNILLFGILPFL